MYRRYLDDGALNPDFLNGLESFIEFTCSQPAFMDRDKIKCPCRKCKNISFQEPYTVRLHIAKHEFVWNYDTWTFQGKINRPERIERDMVDDECVTSYDTMVMDAAGPQYNINAIDYDEETPNPNAQCFYDMLKAADKELWPGCEQHSQLSVVACLMAIKSENNMSEKCFDQITQLM
ncbi:hypothetical protein C2S52_021806 [Perilla frutescens var. hirtella]|nr:hypothetical protein C2S52_021806 [Perilla frutescens var. hirtella]